MTSAFVNFLLEPNHFCQLHLGTANERPIEIPYVDANAWIATSVHLATALVKGQSMVLLHRDPCQITLSLEGGEELGSAGVASQSTAQTKDIFTIFGKIPNINRVCIISDGGDFDLERQGIEGRRAGSVRRLIVLVSK